MSETQKNKATTFGTAYDLPKVRELIINVRAFERAGYWLSSDQRAKLSELRNALSNTVQTVDNFYDLLGPRNWVFHGDMNVSRLQEVIQAEDAKSAEERLIAYYKDKEATKYLFTRLFRVEAFRPRSHSISRAYEDFLEGRYYACVLALIPVLDGVVNDVEKSKRRGLHARAPEELIAWDSVTAHHFGLKHTQATFTKTFRKTVEAEVYELFRHGIVHGMVINFDNAVVAAKALNQIFAIADWAESVSNLSETSESLPSHAELQTSIRDLVQAKKGNATFQKRELVLGQPGFREHEIVVIANKYLEAWHHENYGQLATFFPQYHNESRGLRAGQAKSLYRDYRLNDFRVSKVVEVGQILSKVEVQTKINGAESTITLRWVQMDESAQPVLPGKPGEWTLAPHGPSRFLAILKNNP